MADMAALMNQPPDQAAPELPSPVADARGPLTRDLLQSVLRDLRPIFAEFNQSEHLAQSTNDAHPLAPQGSLNGNVVLNIDGDRWLIPTVNFDASREAVMEFLTQSIPDPRSRRVLLERMCERGSRVSRVIEHHVQILRDEDRRRRHNSYQRPSLGRSGHILFDDIDDPPRQDATGTSTQPTRAQFSVQGLQYMQSEIERSAQAYAQNVERSTMQELRAEIMSYRYEIAPDEMSYLAIGALNSCVSTLRYSPEGIVVPVHVGCLSRDSKKMAAAAIDPLGNVFLTHPAEVSGVCSFVAARHLLYSILRVLFNFKCPIFPLDVQEGDRSEEYTFQLLDSNRLRAYPHAIKFECEEIPDRHGHEHELEMEFWYQLEEGTLLGNVGEDAYYLMSGLEKNKRVTTQTGRKVNFSVPIER